MLRIKHYGVHWLDGDIAMLYQGGDKGITTFGMEVDAKIVTKGFPVVACNHEIDLNDCAELPEHLRNDPLVQALSPVPKTGRPPVPVFNQLEVNEELLLAMLQMSAIKKPTIVRIDEAIRKVETRGWMFNSTNVEPVIIKDVSYNRRLRTNTIVMDVLSKRRKLMLLAYPSAVLKSPVVWETTQVTDADINLPWRQIGAGLLREYMSEQTNSTAGSGDGLGYAYRQPSTPLVERSRNR